MLFLRHKGFFFVFLFYSFSHNKRLKETHPDRCVQPLITLHVNFVQP